MRPRNHQELLEAWYHAEISMVDEFARTTIEREEMEQAVADDATAYAAENDLADPSVHWRRRREERLSAEALELVEDFLAAYEQGH